MKHTYKLLLIAVAITFIAACKKSSSSSSNPIVGKWTIVSDTIRLYQGGSLSDVSADSLLGANNYYQFNANGTGNFAESGNSDTFTWSVSGSTLTATNAAETIDGIAIPSETSTATIKTLDAHNLYLFSSSTASVDGVDFPETEATHFTR